MKLSDEPSRRLSWVFGGDGLSKICGMETFELLKEIGHDNAWLQSKLALGFAFKLCVFPEVEAVLADWDGVFHLVEKVNPFFPFKRL